MFVDAVKEGQDVTLATDLCIVGAGAAGLALSREFLNSRTEVIILESGGPPGENTPYDLNKVEVVGLPSYGAERARERGFGGTTRVWPGQCMRLDSIDFSKRPWVPHSGWPVTRAEIDPYYARAEALLELPVDALAQNVGTLLGVHQPDFDPAKLSLTFSMFSPRPDMGHMLGGGVPQRAQHCDAASCDRGQDTNQ